MTTAWVLSLAGFAGCGASPHVARSSRSIARVPPRSPAAARLVYQPLFALTAPVQDPATAPLGADRFVLLGGLDSADRSTATVTLANLHGPLTHGLLAGAQHDAQAATIAGEVYVFGGGDFTQYDHIIRFDPATGHLSAIGRLPRPASDVGVTQSDGTAYIVGGFDGTDWLDTILAWRPGAVAAVVGHLPIGLRYAAVTAIDGAVLIVGGTTPTGASDAIFRFDPASGHVRQIGRLPQRLTHAGAAALGASAFVVGGRGESTDSQSDRVWSIDPSGGRVRLAGRLPRALSDAGVLAVGSAILVAGGQTGNGTQAGVGELVPSG